MSKLRIMQFGRSMSEILGVLAVIGLLSITGLYGYHRAMNKHKANEITATIQRQLPLVAAALANETTPDDYYDEDVAGIGADIWLSEDRDGSEMLPRGTDKKFRMNVGKLPKELCKDLISSLRGAETKVHSITGDVNCDKDSNDLGIVYNADLSADCDAGYGRQDGFCEECADGLMSDGKTGCGECDPGTKASDNHQSCDPCEAGDTTCGCENKADGNGGCTDCIENGDCDSENMCHSGYCYSCPKYAKCDPEKSGFDCRKGYDELDKLCCPPNANCSTEDNGSLIVSCSKNYYYQQTETDESCQPCEGIKHALSCKGGQEGLKCDKDEGYEMKNGGCCLIGAECDLNEEGEYEAYSCPEDTYLFDGECLTCPDGASCPGGDEGFTCDKDTYLSASGDECLICPENATCPGGVEGFECDDNFVPNEAGTACECQAGYDMCGGKCYPKCGKNQTGRDDQCNCVCRPGTNEETCECPAGSVYINGTCARIWCVPTSGAANYQCRIILNQKEVVCGQYCKSANINKDNCMGYCANYCAQGTWGTSPIDMRGLGCIANNGLYCAQEYSGKWWCTPSSNEEKMCCKGSNFAQCEVGTCTSRTCTDNNSQESPTSWSYSKVARAYDGCKVTYNNKSIYCYPNGTFTSGDNKGKVKWTCQYEISEVLQAACASCTLDQLKLGENGACQACFGDQPDCKKIYKYWPGAEWDTTLKRCVGEGYMTQSEKDTTQLVPRDNDKTLKDQNHEKYSCDLKGHCYYGTTNNQCGWDCKSSIYCGSGMCGNVCPTGTTYAYGNGNTSFLKAYGCKRIDPDNEKKYFFFLWRSSNASVCYYGDDEKKFYCGKDCNYDCTECREVNHVKCAGSKNKCSIGKKITNNCNCTEAKGVESNGYCCPPGHIYFNGGCSIVNRPDGKCFYGDTFIDEKTDEYVASDSGYCQCVDTKLCMDDSGNLPVCGECSEIEEILDEE